MPRDETLRFIRSLQNIENIGAGERSRTSYPRITDALPALFRKSLYELILTPNAQR